MKKNYVPLILLGISFTAGFKAQTVVFDYDESGNQIYRGPCIGCKESNTMISKQSEKTLAEIFENQIKAAPVPVKTDLTVMWDKSIRDYIIKIDLLPYNAFRVMETVDIKSISDNSYIFKMSPYSYGVYYLKFYLSDGSIYTRIVTKN